MGLLSNQADRKPRRQRLSDWWFDLRHPLTTLMREAAMKHCSRHSLVMVEQTKYEWQLGALRSAVAAAHSAGLSARQISDRTGQSLRLVRMLLAGLEPRT